MDVQLTRETLIKRIADLETELRAQRGDSAAACSFDAFSLADIDHAADGISVCHAIDSFPFVRFTFWNRRMVELSGYDVETINRKGWYQSVYPDPDVQAKAVARMAEMREGKNLEAETWEITRADGKTRTLRISTSILDHGDGKARVMAIMHDMSRLKDAETALINERETLRRELTDVDHALKTSDARYRALFENAGDAIFIHDLDGTIVDANQKALSLFGYTHLEITSIQIAMLHPVSAYEKSKWAFETIIRDGQVTFETDFINKSGEIIPTEVSSSLYKIGGKQVIQGIVRDIRERRQVEQARRETFNIIDKSPVVAFVWRNEMDWPVEFTTMNVARIFGYSVEDFLTGRVLYSNVVHADDLERVFHEVKTGSQDSDETAFNHEPYRIVTRDSSVRWVNDRTYIRRDHTGTITHYQGIVEDITDRVVAEQLLKESEEKFSRAFQLIPDPVMITSVADGRIINVNDSFVQASGYSLEEVIGCSSLTDIGLWEDPAERDRYVETLSQDGAVRNMECRFRVKNGDVRLGSICGQMLEVNGEPCILGTMRDITEERLSARKLAAEKERLAVTLRSIGDAVITTDAQGRIALMNPIAEDLTGWPETDAVGQPLMDVFRIVNEKTRQACTNPVERVLSTGQIVGLANHTMLIARDGREFCIADSGAPIFDLQGQIVGVVLVFRDTTEGQRIESELRKMEKLQSLGVLAGGIAHDFNNFLTGIIGNLSLAKLDISAGSPVSRALDDMERAAIRAKDLTQQLLTFSKGGEPVKTTTSMADLVRESAQFVLTGSNVSCKLEIDDDLYPADVDEGQITQVIQNLMINANQSMPDGGVVSVHGENVSLLPDNGYALEPGDYLKLSITDQGVGISPEYLKRVFDPYFSTKQKGSGLGLAVAYSITAKHDGKLSVESKPGQGSTFSLRLPASQRSLPNEVAAQNHLITGSGRILVMDDEDFVRELAATMLDKIGYEATVAEDGRTAVALYRDALDAGRPFDAVILDLTVPGGMGGKETVQELAAMDPGVCAIVSSGYSNDPVMAKHRSYGFSGAVKKPYLLQDLSQVIDEVLKR